MRRAALAAPTWPAIPNPEIDDLLVEALQTVDDAERERLLREASRAGDGHLRHRADPLRADHLGDGAGAGTTKRAPTSTRWATRWFLTE